MESYRLKNIIIIVLLMLNLFLAVLLLNFRWQGLQARRELREQLYELFSASEITLGEDLELDQDAPPSLSIQRDLEAEAAIAALLLGEEVPAEHQGGGIYAYTGTAGAVHFRSSGDFDYVPDSPAIDDPEDFCRTFCQSYGYEPSASNMPGGSGAFTAIRVVEGGAVYNCTVSFQFENGQLTSLTGAYVSTQGSASTGSASLSAVDALVRFLDYRNQNGVICSSIQAVTPVYELQSGPSAPLQLTAKWQVTTDTYQYYVDCSTGDVVRA